MDREILKSLGRNAGTRPILVALLVAHTVIGSLNAEERYASNKTERHNPPVITNLTALTPEQMAQALVGPGVTIQNVTYTGAPQAAGTFTEGDPNILFTEGVMLSSGNIADISGPNQASNISTSFGRPGDSDLSVLSGFLTFDATVLEFEFIPDFIKVSVSYRFGSEEYNEFVFTQFNDAFAFFINGENCAIVDGDPVSIDTINNGFGASGVDAQNPHLYINNDPFNGGINPADVQDTEMDGFTVPLLCEADVNPNVVNTMKIVIADASDTVLDSWVVLEAASLTTRTVREQAVRLALTLEGGPYVYGAKGIDFRVGGPHQYVEPEEILEGAYRGLVCFEEDFPQCEQLRSEMFDPNAFGLDCSGLITWAYDVANGAITHRDEDSIYGETHSSAYCSDTHSVELNLEGGDMLQPGDILCYPDHIAMYAGEFERDGEINQWVVEARDFQNGISVSRLSERQAGATFRSLIDPRIDAEIIIDSPVQIIVVDPNGIVLTPDTLDTSATDPIRGIPGVMWYVFDGVGEDGEPKERVIIPKLVEGRYSIQVVAKLSALPSDTYGLRILAHGEVIVLAENVPVHDIPSLGYGVQVSGEELIQFIPIAIDIKPGSDPNSINPRSRGVIPVAILTTTDFDATTVDPLSVMFGPNGAVETHGRGHIEDVDRDGDDDMVLHFRTQETGIACGDTAASLTGQILDGTPIEGSDSIRTVGCR